MSTHQEGIPRHPIRVVARRTGLSPSVLRAWDRRYRVVRPGRSEGGQRLYSDRDIERLFLLKRAKEADRSIGRIPKLSLGDLSELVEEDADLEQREALAAATFGRRPPGSDMVGGEVLLAEATQSVERIDANGLDRQLMRAAVLMAPQAFLGPDLPADDVAFAARQLGAGAVALSAVHLQLDAQGIGDLAMLLQLLPPDVRLFVGGAAVEAHRATIEAIGGVVLESMDELRVRLLDEHSVRRAS
jgi:DNA-binding transcriptional MerR regulator